MLEYKHNKKQTCWYTSAELL